MSSRRRRTRYSPWWGFLIGSSVMLVGVAGWSELLTKPVVALKHSGSVRRTLIDLVTGNGIYDGVGEGLLFLGLTVMLLFVVMYGIARFAARLNHYLEKSRVDISMLRTAINIHIVDDAMTTARITRHQIFHANAADVQAYYYSHTPDVGRVDETSFSIQTVVVGEVLTDVPEIFPIAGGKGLDITETFCKPLPTSFLATYLSDRWVLALHRNLRLFDKIIATREVGFVSTGEYNQDTPRDQMQFLRYPANEVVFTINFPSCSAPLPTDIRVSRMRENAATTIIPSYQPQGDRIVVSFAVTDAENERVRIRWSNGRLKAHLASTKRGFLGLGR